MILRDLKSVVIVIFLGLLNLRSRDAYRFSRQKRDTPASSDDELEVETSFSTFTPKGGFVNPSYEVPSTFQPPVASDDTEAIPMGAGQRGLAKSRKCR